MLRKVRPPEPELVTKLSGTYHTSRIIRSRSQSSNSSRNFVAAGSRSNVRARAQVSANDREPQSVVPRRPSILSRRASASSFSASAARPRKRGRLRCRSSFAHLRERLWLLDFAIAQRFHHQQHFPPGGEGPVMFALVALHRFEEFHFLIREAVAVRARIRCLGRSIGHNASRVCLG